jgi:hypothetical protein
MIKLDWQPREDWSQSDQVSTDGRSVPSRFLAQGVRDALRSAYVDSGGGLPDELSSLLEKLR